MPVNHPKTADIVWQNNGEPLSVGYGDTYFSTDGGALESRHVFLGGNDLPARFRDGFSIAELGFGTGLNMLVAWQAWRRAGLKTALHYTSFEAAPLTHPDMARALSSFAELGPLVGEFLAKWSPDIQHCALDRLTLTVIIGDAAKTLPKWHAAADAWFLDGFAPAKNPALWSDAILADVAAHTNPAGTLATYTAVGRVRRRLADVGFSIDRVPGFGRKRHMTIGRLKDM